MKMFSKIVAGLMLPLFVFAASLVAVAPAEAQVINSRVAVCDPANPIVCQIPSGSGAGILNCVFNSGLPSYTNAQTTQCQSTSGGAIYAAVAGNATAGADGLSNANIIYPFSANGAATQATLRTGLSVAPLVFNGTTWDRMAGNAAGGQFVQGPKAAGVAVGGNPVLMAGSDIFGSNAVRTLATDSVGDLFITATYQTSSGTAPGSPVLNSGLFDGTNQQRAFTCPNTAVVNVTAAATTQLVALSGATSIRVCAMALTISLAGTAKFVSGTGANCGTGTADITGAMTLAAGTPLAMGDGAGGSVLRAPASAALCLAAVTGNVTGFVTYAQF